MRFSPLLTATVALAALAVLASPVAAQQRPVSGARITYPSQSNLFSWERGNGFRGGFGNVWVVEREVPVYVQVPAPAPPPVTPPLPPHQGEGDRRKPYVIGASYASLPGSCMKLIEDGVSFYYCSGDWYRQEGKSYRAVARKL